MDRRTALLRALPILLITIPFGVLIIFLALRTAGGVRLSEDVVAAYEPILPVCDGEAVASAPAYDPAGAAHAVVVLRRTGAGWAPDPAVAPDAWQPDEPAGAELVLCLEAALPLTTPACDGEQEARTYGYATTARLVASATGEEVASAILNSAPDPGCWHTEPEEIPLGSQPIQTWLAPYVQPGTDE